MDILYRRKTSLSGGYLKEKMRDVFDHPCRYIKAIGEIMDIYNRKG